MGGWVVGDGKEEEDVGGWLDEKVRREKTGHGGEKSDYFQDILMAEKTKKRTHSR
jgi:hypothetical protein